MAEKKEKMEEKEKEEREKKEEEKKETEKKKEKQMSEKSEKEEKAGEGEGKESEKKMEESKEKGENDKEEKKEQEERKKGKKKEYAVAYGKDFPISTKHSIEICRFIKNRKIEEAIKILEEVVKKKVAVPFRGEIPHRKGKMMSGRYPVKASKYFIRLLKSLSANALQNNLEIEKTIIKIASANKASQPLKRFGRARFKRTHIYLKAEENKNTK